MKLSILMGVGLGLALGVAAQVRATEPCEPVTYLTLEKVTKNGVDEPLPTVKTTEIASASTSYVLETLYDPIAKDYVSVSHAP